MSLPLRPVPPVPEDTARVARAAFPDGNPYLRLRDELGTIFDDDDFADLYPRPGTARRRPLAAGPGHRPAVPRGPLRPPGRRRRPRPHRLEVPARPGADRPGLRRLRALRVPLPPARRRGRGAAAGAAAGALQGPGAAQGPRPAAHRLDPRPGPRPRHQPPGVCGRDAAACPEQPGGRRPGVAPRPQLRRNGSSATAGARTNPGSRPRPRSARPTPAGSARTAHALLAAAYGRTRRRGSGRCPPSRPCGGSGSSSSPSTPGGCGGGPRPMASRRRGCISSPYDPEARLRQEATRRPGSATRST